MPSTRTANTYVMSNLVSVLNDLGRVSESTASSRKLRQMEPNPAFSYFDRGLAAMRHGDLKSARDLFAKEVDRAPYYHEFHFWLAVAYIGLGEIELGKKELTLAMQSSTTQERTRCLCGEARPDQRARQPLIIQSTGAASAASSFRVQPSWAARRRVDQAGKVVRRPRRSLIPAGLFVATPDVAITREEAKRAAHAPSLPESHSSRAAR